MGRTSGQSAKRTASDLGIGVLSEASIQNSVGDLIADLVCAWGTKNKSMGQRG